MIAFIHSFQSEWLKRRHTAAVWLVVACALFMPLIVLGSRLVSFEHTYHENTTVKNFWMLISYRNWAATGMFLLPLVLILSTSLITNIEYKNNTWKQLHTTPQTFSVIYFAKLAVLVVMLLQLFIIFNIGIYLSGILPSLVFRGLDFPKPFPLHIIVMTNLRFFVDCLPILAIQYLLGLQFKNFLVPIGVGFSLLVISLLALGWQYGYIVPYTYVPLNFEENQTFIGNRVNRHYWAIGYFIIITILGYILYMTKKQKG